MQRKAPQPRHVRRLFNFAFGGVRCSSGFRSSALQPYAALRLRSLRLVANGKENKNQEETRIPLSAFGFLVI